MSTSSHLSDWLDHARRLTPAERAAVLAQPEPQPSTTVDPELTDALTDLRRAVEMSGRVLYARTFALRYGHTGALGALQRLGTRWQCEAEACLELVEAIACAGRR